MKAPFVFVLLILITLGIVGFVEFSKRSKLAAAADEVRALHAQLRQAADNSDGEGVAKLLTQKSFEHYQGILQQALDADEARTKALPPNQLVEVLTIRSKATRKEIKKLDGRGYVVHAVKNGWWSNSEDPLVIKEVNLNGDWGTVVLYDKEWADEAFNQRVGNFFSGRRRRLFSSQPKQEKIPTPPDLKLRVIKENGSWKFCDAASAQGIDTYMGDMAKLFETTPTKMIMFDFEDEDGKFDSKLLKPMK